MVNMASAIIHLGDPTSFRQYQNKQKDLHIDLILNLMKLIKTHF